MDNPVWCSLTDNLPILHYKKLAFFIDLINYCMNIFMHNSLNYAVIIIFGMSIIQNH